MPEHSVGGQPPCALTSGLVNVEAVSQIGLPSPPSQPGTGQELSRGGRERGFQGGVERA